MAFEKTTDFKVLATELVKRLNEDMRRIRMLEERLDRMEGRVRTMEESSLDQMESLRVNVERIGEKLASITEKFKLIDSEIVRMSKDLSKSVTKSEVKSLENFIDILNPITSRFVTKDEMQRAIEDQKKV
jgi:TolA-binding protein